MAFSLAKTPTLFWLWLGQTVSRVGDFMYELALAWWVLQKTGSPTLMGMVLVFAVPGERQFGSRGRNAGTVICLFSYGICVCQSVARARETRPPRGFLMYGSVIL